MVSFLCVFYALIKKNLSGRPMFPVTMFPLCLKLSMFLSVFILTIHSDLSVQIREDRWCICDRLLKEMLTLAQSRIKLM
jgi:hypothetical protein